MIIKSVKMKKKMFSPINILKLFLYFLLLNTYYSLEQSKISENQLKLFVKFSSLPDFKNFLPMNPREGLLFYLFKTLYKRQIH